MLSGCSADGSVLGSGPRGRGFKSRHSDHGKNLAISTIAGFLLEISTVSGIWSIAFYYYILHKFALFLILLHLSIEQSIERISLKPFELSKTLQVNSQRQEKIIGVVVQSACIKSALE